MNGERYLGNRNKTEVNDLDSENTNCQIDEIIKAGNDRPFNSLTQASQSAMPTVTTVWAGRLDSQNFPSRCYAPEFSGLLVLSVRFQH